MTIGGVINAMSLKSSLSTSALVGTPVLILKEGSSRRRGREALRGNIDAAKVVAEVVKATLGPRGMDKMLVDTIGDWAARIT